MWLCVYLDAAVRASQSTWSSSLRGSPACRLCVYCACTLTQLCVLAGRCGRLPSAARPPACRLCVYCACTLTRLCVLAGRRGRLPSAAHSPVDCVAAGASVGRWSPSFSSSSPSSPPVSSPSSSTPRTPTVRPPLRHSKTCPNLHRWRPLRANDYVTEISSNINLHIVANYRPAPP